MPNFQNWFKVHKTKEKTKPETETWVFEMSEKKLKIVGQIRLFSI